MSGIKFALFGAFAAIVSNLIGDVAAGAVAAAAAFAALGYVWRLVRRAARTYDVIERLPATMARIEKRLDRLENTTAATLEPVEAVARDLGVERRQH